MKVAVIYNKPEINDSDVINVFGMRTKEKYNPKLIDAVASALEKGGHNVRIFDGNKQIIDELQNFMPKVVRGERPGMVFNMAYGIQGQSRYTHIPAMLEMLGIPYIGSGPAGHAIALDKVMSKIVFLRHDLPTPQFWVFSNPNENFSEVKYPVIVKPKMEAVSFGLRVVHQESDLREAISTIVDEFQQQTLVEEFIPGREFAVGLLGNGTSLETLPIVEIDLGGDPNAFQSVDDKMQHPREKVCPAPIPSELEENLSTLAKKAFHALGLFDFARVDFRMDKDGRLFILEINSMASLNKTGSFVKEAEVAGLDFDALINRMLDVAAIRYFGKTFARKTPVEKKNNRHTEPLHFRVRSYMRSHLSTMVDYIEQMVSINSYVHNIEGVNTLGSWVSNRFLQLGFHRQIVPQVEAGNMYCFKNHTDEQNDILLLTHLDTVYDYQNYVSFYEEKGRLFGSGVAESKGGLSIIITALHSLRFARVLKSIRVCVLVTSDNSFAGRYSKKIISDAASNSRYVIGTKYGDPDGGVVISCSGAHLYQIEFTNIKNFRTGEITNVMASISQKILSWQRLSSEEKGIFVTVNEIHARTNPGRTSDHASASLTSRYKDKTQVEQIDEIVKKIAEKGTNGSLQVQFRISARRLPVLASDENKKFYDKVEKIAKLLEIPLHPIHRQISSDMCYVPEHVSVLGGLGPLGGDIRSPNEYIIRDSLIERASLLAMIINESTQ